MKCFECGISLIGLGGKEINTKSPVKVLRSYTISEYHYILEDDRRLCENCFNLWWYGMSFKKNREIAELKRKIFKLEGEMRKGAE